MLVYAVLAFAVVFMVTGILRVVEFKAAGVSAFQRKFLIPLHILGCIAFAASLALAVIDPEQHYKMWMTILFFTGVLILFPTHIYVAIKRKIKFTK